jgi:hypothetical protein
MTDQKDKGVVDTDDERLVNEVEATSVKAPMEASQVGKRENSESEWVEMLSEGMEKLKLRSVPEEREGFGEMLGFQEETGQFVKRVLPDHAMVISQGWPSWTFALEGLGFCSVSTIASFDSSASKAEFQATEMGSTLVNKEELSPWLERHDDKGIVFVQGEQAFLEAAYHKLCSSDEFRIVERIVFVCSDVTFTSADSLRVSHADAGGITNGEWSFYTQAVPLTSLKLSKVKRRLKHVLRTTEGAGSNHQLDKISGGLLNGNDLLPFGEKTSAVRAKSVFEKGKLVSRLISSEELMDAYDLELTVQASLNSHCKTSGKALTRSFVNSVPTKVLRLVAKELIEKTMKECCFVVPVRALKERNQKVLPLSVPGSLGENAVDGSDGKAAATESPTIDVAARPDDAEAEAEDWDKWLVSSFVCPYGKDPLVCKGDYDVGKHGPLFKSLRELLVRRFRRNVLRSFLSFMGKKHGREEIPFTITRSGKCKDKVIKAPTWAVKSMKGKNLKGKLWELYQDLEVGRDAVARAADSSWWNWDAGSTLFFWRWPARVCTSVRDGTKLFVDKTKLPCYMKKQQWPGDPVQKAKLEKKVRKVRDRGYIKPGFVKSLTGFFAVPKAIIDIRVVYDATQCGLNDALWAPNFFLPTVDSILRNASSSTWFGDIDLGEMFLNYALDMDIRMYTGVDVTEVADVAAGAKRVLERWTRTLMGLRSSPFVCTQTFAWSEEIIVGDHLEFSNPFYWDKVILNLPGTLEYNPTMPRVYRWNSREKCMACFFGTYIDDIRTGGPTEAACKATSRRVASRINYLGQQDAARKRGQPDQQPRAWAGAKCCSLFGKGLFVFSTKEKWLKAQTMVNKWSEVLAKEDLDTVSFSELEKDVGFLVHISRTYPAVFPYLKGFYNTMNSWRLDRDGDGWKFSKTAWIEMLSGDVAFENEADVELPFENRKRNFAKAHQKEKPTEVKVVPRFVSDLSALKILFSAKEPPLRLVRGKQISSAIFGFGDASGGGFGSSWETSEGIAYRFGTWGENMDSESSNLREFLNLVDTLEKMCEDDKFRGTEIFLFTDNSTSELAFFNGSSKSEKLFKLVLRLRQLEMQHGVIVHLCHVSGERMKAQGSDGLSRGNLNVGVMAGTAMLDFVPIHLDAFERSATLLPWIQAWTGEDELELLTPAQWFTRGHDLQANKWEYNIDGLKMPTTKSGLFVWSPAPAAAETAIEELRKARHKRQRSHHLVVIPRLMQPYWRKQLYKAADVVITLPPGHPAWPTEMFEPLTLAFVFPFVRYRPWQLRGSVHLLALGREVSRLWRDNLPGEGFILRQLWGVQRKVSCMQEKLARQMLLSEQVGNVSSSNPRKRRGSKVDKNKRRSKVQR